MSRDAPFDHWKSRARELVYLLKHEVITLHNIAGKIEDKKVSAKMRDLANIIESHAESLKDYLDGRKRV